MLDDKSIRWWVWSIPFVLLLVISSSCEERIRPSILSDLRGKELPSHESWNTTITFSDSGTTKAILKVGHLAKYEYRQKTLLDAGLHVDFFDVNGRHTSVLTAQGGSVNDRTNDLEAVGTVIVVSDSGTTLETERLLWENSTRRVQSNDFVKIVSPKEEIQGHGLDSDQNLNNYKIFRVTGQMSLTK